MVHKGKKVLITGGTRGIGRAVALHLAEEGCELVLNYLDNQEAADETLSQAQKKNGRASLVKANLADPEQIRMLADETVRTLGGVDYVVHCAALGTFKNVSDLRINQWDLSFDINVKSFLILSQRLSKHMKEGSSIVALSSGGAQKVLPHYGAIGTSKAALESLVRYLAVEFIGRGIRVNAVSAGPIDTRSLSAFPEHEKLKQELIRRTPAGRLGKPEDLVGLVSFLCSSESQWIVGQTIVADGGLSLQ